MLLVCKCLETKKFRHPRRYLEFELNSLNGKILEPAQKIKIEHNRLPFRFSDCVVAKCQKNPDGVYSFLQTPMTRESKNPVDLLNKITEMLPLGFGHRAAQIISLSKDITVFLDRLTFSYSDELKEILPKKLVLSFLGKWKTNSVIRKLLLRGLDRRIVYRSDILASFSFYQNFLRCPYVCPLITMQEAAQMMLRNYQQPTDEDIYCGNVLRKVYNTTRERGWTCVPIKELEQLFPGFLEYQSILKNKFRLFFQFECVYYYPQYIAEWFLNQRFSELLQSETLIPNQHYSFQKTSEKCDLKLSQDQEECLRRSLDENIVAITGPAGSGKTTIIREFTRHLRARGHTWVLCAPTGKAAHRLFHSCQQATFTLHRLQMMIAGRQNSVPNRIDYLIIDESSMVCCRVLQKLLVTINKVQSFKPRMLFFGDVNQLPPIECGSVFREMIKSKKTPVFRLSTNHRNKNGGQLIVENAQNILSFDHKTGEEFTYQEGQDFVVSVAKKRTFYRFLKSLDFNSDVVVITPYNKVMLEVNLFIQEQVKKENESEVQDYQGNVWRKGNRVIMNKNNYEFGVMNGESGVITSIDESSVTVDFYQSGIHRFTLGKRKKQWQSTNRKSYWSAGEQLADGYDKEQDDEIKKDLLSTDVLSLAYCLTIHKSQGSEWQHCIIYVPLGVKTSNFLTRELLYTAITRGRQKVTIMGDDMIICSAVQNKSKARVEWLHRRLIQN